MNLLPELKIYSILALLLLNMGSCLPDRKPESKTDIASEKALDSDMLDQAMKEGGEIASQAQAIMGKQLKNAIKKGGPKHAISFCQKSVYPILDSMQNLYHAEIRRVSFKVRNPADHPRLIESQILRAYEKDHNRSDSLLDRVQEIDDQYVLFTRPILIENAICLKCHGVPEVDIAVGTMEVLKSLYPDDKAVGYALSDLRGMWSIKLKKKK